MEKTASSILAAAAKAAGIPTGRGNDSRFFTTTKKGELHELKEELNSPKLPIKRDASRFLDPHICRRPRASIRH